MGVVGEGFLGLGWGFELWSGIVVKLKGWTATSGGERPNFDEGRAIVPGLFRGSEEGMVWKVSEGDNPTEMAR